MSAPGWYPDPSDPSRQRWWDGAAWGATAEPAATTPTPPSPWGQPAQPTPEPPTAQQTPWGQPAQQTPHQQSPYQQSPYQQSPYQQSPYQQGQPQQGQPQPGGWNQQTAYAQPNPYAPQPPASSGKGGRTALIIGLVVVLLAAAGGAAWYFLRETEASLDDVMAALEDNGLDCDDPEEIDPDDIEEARDEYGKDVRDAIDAALDLADGADLEGIDCSDEDDDDRGAAILTFDDDGTDRVALVLRSDTRAFAEDDVDGSVIVATLDEDRDDGDDGGDDGDGGSDSALVEACRIEKRTIETALEAYYAEWDYYPDYLDELFDYLNEIPSEDDWYYDSYEGTVEAMSGYTYSDDEASECNGF